MLCENKTTGTIKFEIDTTPGKPPTRYSVAPGVKVEIADGYCKPFINSGGKPSKPIIELIAPGLVPLPGQYAEGHEPPPGALNEQVTPAELLAEMRNLVAFNSKLAQQNEEQALQIAELRQLVAPVNTGDVPADQTSADLPEASDIVGGENETDEDDEAAADLSDYNVEQLRTIAKEAGVKGYKSMKRSELEAAIQEAPAGE